VFRPADAVETAECWQLALQNANGPSLLALTRQNLPAQRGDAGENLSAKGAYRLKAAEAPRQAILIATGSEVALAVEVAAALEREGIGADVVSMPSWELFEAQDAAYRSDLLPDEALRVSIEAGTTFGWERYTMPRGLRIGIDQYGASAPAKDLFAHFGFTVGAILPKILAELET
jgi:transketolase